MLNRTAIILRYQEPFVRWINEADPVVEEPNIDIEPDECTVYLIHEIETREDIDGYPGNAPQRVLAHRRDGHPTSR